MDEKKITTTIVLKPENMERLRSLKEATGIPMSRILEQGVEEKLDWEEKRMEAIKNGGK
jgi:predicted transcriptional regulator